MQEGKVSEALDAIQQSLVMLDESQMRLYAAAARICLGQIVSGDEGCKLQNEGFDYMQTQNIRNPPAMLEILAPGFPY